MRSVVLHVVTDLVFDEHNEAEMARHGVVRHDVEQVKWNRNLLLRNHRGRPGSVLLIGETDGGRLLIVPLVPTVDPTTWRPATAFDAGRHHRALFDRRYR